MADVSILAGATSQSILVDLYVLATGAPQTALVYNSTSLTAYYSFANATAGSVAISLATLAATTTAYSSGGFIKIDDTNMPGLYRLDLPNAAIAAAKGREVCITLTGFSGMATRHIKVELTGWDNQDAVHGGMSALPNTACTTNASLITSGTGTAQLNVSSGHVVTVDTLTTYTGNTVQTGDSFARIGSAGAGLTNIGTIATCTNLTNAPTNGDLTATMKTSVTTAATAATPTIAGYTGNTPQTGDAYNALVVATYAEPAQGTPASTTTLIAKINYLYKAWRNKSTQTSTTYSLLNNDAVTVDHKSTTADDGTTFTRGAVTTGP